jgi:adenosylcobyric acid synthase
VLLLEPEERALLRGYIVNKFRGDPSLFDSAHPFIQARTGLKSMGVVTWFEPARDLPKEDIVGLAELAKDAREHDGRPITVAAPRLPRLANFDDLDPLAAERDVRLLVLEPGEPLPAETDLVLLPGSKATLGDLAALQREGWDVDIRAHARRGGWVVGLCGGYQMLGRTIADPEGLEGAPGTAAGLGLLEVDTVLEPVKTLALRDARELATGEAVRGYEIHMGRTRGPGCGRPMLQLEGAVDGAVSPDGRVMGCYLHGLFAADRFRHAFLDRIRRREPSGVGHEARVEAALDGLAAHLERCLDLDRLLAIARGGVRG